MVAEALATPELHAEPVDTHAPSRSSAIAKVAPSHPGNRALTVLPTCKEAEPSTTPSWASTSATSRRRRS